MDSSHYIITKEYRLVRFNHQAEKLHPGIKEGMLCYEALANRNAPCAHCPIANHTSDTAPLHFDAADEHWRRTVFAEDTEDTYTVTSFRVNEDSQGLPDLFSDKEREKLGDKANPMLISQLRDYWAREKKQVKSLTAAIKALNDTMLDPMTGCKNRMSLDLSCDGDCDRTKSVALVIMDINGLKKVNDCQGHEAGDQLICDSAETIKSIYGQDCTYRLGGDEFAVVLRGITEEALQEKCESFRKCCEEKQLSISCGAVFRDHLEITQDELFREADSRMYEEKRAHYRRLGIDRRSSSEMFRNAEYLEAMHDYGNSSLLIIRFDLQEDSYEIVHAAEGIDTSYKKDYPKFSDAQKMFLQMGTIHPEDYDDFQRFTAPEYLSKEARLSHGKDDFQLRFRVFSPMGMYRMCEMQCFAAKEYTDEHQIAYMILRDRGQPYIESRLTFEDILKELASNFDTVLYIDFALDMVRIYRVSELFESRISPESPDELNFEKVQKLFLEKIVVEEDRERMRAIFSRDYLEKKLSEYRTYVHDFHVKDGDKLICYRVKISNIEGAGPLRHCAVGFVNVDIENMWSQQI